MTGLAVLAMDITRAGASSCGDPGPGMQLIVNGTVAFLVALIPAIYSALLVISARAAPAGP